MTDLSSLHSTATNAIESAESLDALEHLRVQYLGKKGEITGLLKTLGGMEPEQRKTFGAEVNQVKQEVAARIDAKKEQLEAKALEAQLEQERIDVTLPPREFETGRLHPLTHVTEEIIALFAKDGFTVADGPDIEDDDHNFTALNIAEHHPARQMHDTFYLHPSPLGRGARGEGSSHNMNLSSALTPGTREKDTAVPFSRAPSLSQGEREKRHVLRTHTSPVQIRTMRAGKPPFRVLAPGTTYRSDSDQTHTPMFHQIEGLVIDKNIHMGHLKGCLIEFIQAFFGQDVPVRFRPSYFPFTEPSSEVDIGCKKTKDALIIGEGDDWLEVLGCGMVHPEVLKNCGIDPDEWQGFAFGLGIERLAMLKYNIPDLRTFFESDVRWLKHYGFAA